MVGNPPTKDIFRFNRDKRGYMHVRFHICYNLLSPIGHTYSIYGAFKCTGC